MDVIAILSARKAKSRAQLTAMRTTVAYTRTMVVDIMVPTVCVIRSHKKKI